MNARDRRRSRRMTLESVREATFRKLGYPGEAIVPSAERAWIRGYLTREAKGLGIDPQSAPSTDPVYWGAIGRWESHRGPILRGEAFQVRRFVVTLRPWPNVRRRWDKAGERWIGEPARTLGSFDSISDAWRELATYCKGRPASDGSTGVFIPLVY